MKKEMSFEALELIASRFKVLAEPMRLKLLHELSSGERSVTELIEATGASQANVSKHLGILLEAGLVKRRKDKLNAYYSIADESVFKLCEVVCGSLAEHLETKRKLVG
ncbi:MAG: metalloregulator ArsR/SmtB family transcription factor [Acidobacteriota bacterium]|nr:metalloregulator ArsR/SmtB family transcription factor [Acidobacteriota bacterium]